MRCFLCSSQRKKEKVFIQAMKFIRILGNTKQLSSILRSIEGAGALLPQG